ncbi:MAG: hypothetical protein COV48_04105 [Elusimicrobia bacterium CG11_big_fil_rev_8_21_14_0_20_64_6]|nr:MAG: hypothetical protein COV48_04105 [Elusimicrobia bacterium CG11_big_fil_rev_8_21_14_0_20_64_6]
MSLLLKAVQIYAWGLFAVAWVQMGYVDWKEQKIRNLYLLRWLRFVAAAYAVVLAQSALGGLGIGTGFLIRGYYYELGRYLAFSGLAAYAFWGLRIWPAGDVKLFCLLALFYPLMKIPGSFHSGLRFLEVLINIFVPAAAFLFVTAIGYLWRTRFSHQNQFFQNLGVKRFVVFAFDKGAEAAGLLKTEMAASGRYYREHPGELALDAGAWLAMMSVMAMISYYLNSVITSNVVKTLVCFALFFAWSRFCLAIGKGRALALIFVLFAVLLIRNPHLDWRVLGTVFGHISIFSLCIFFGIQVAFKLVAGQTGFMFLPLLFILPGLIPWATLQRLLVSVLPDAGGLSRWTRIPAGALSELSTLSVWAALGTFFGLSLVFVRIWDAESYQSVSPEQVLPYMTLGPAMVALIQDDEEFCEEHFSTFYADGLTPDQATALKDWCAFQGLDQVPLAPTISFANWIFFGYILTVLINGHVLSVVY